MTRAETLPVPRPSTRAAPLLLILGGLAGAVLLPPLADGLPLAGQRALLVTVAAIALWTTEALEPGVTALLALALLVLTGATPMREALGGFASPVPYFLVGVLTMGAAVVRAGLAERVAHAVLRRARGRGRAVYLQLVVAFVPLTFVLPSATTRSSILIHIYDELFSLAGVARGEPLAKAVMLALSSINRLASTALLTGGITPVMSAAIIGGMSWTGWLVLMAVPYYVLLALGAVLTWGLYRAGFARPLPVVERGPGRPLAPAEWRTGAIILVASVLWLTDGVHHLDPALPALLAFAALLTPGLGPLGWSDLERHVGWANFFVIAASISLAQALAQSGAAPWLARLLVGGLPAAGGSPVASVVLLMLGATGLRALVPNMPGFLALALPLAMSVGREAGLNPLVCALVVMMTGDAVIYYPAQSASALVIYQRGHVTASEFFRFGLWMTLAAYVAILVGALPWWALVGQPLTSAP